MDYQLLAELLFPNVTETPEDVEKKYPPRNLPEGAKVTRFAPSPTGFIHLGGIYGATIDERLAHQSGGVFYLRIEDTDAKREVEGAAEALIRTLAEYGLRFDEGASIGEDGKITDLISRANARQFIMFMRKSWLPRARRTPCLRRRRSWKHLPLPIKRRK